jgi:Ca-activated chloride channel family protein
MIRKWIFPFFLGLLLVGMIFSPVSADGIIIPDPTFIPPEPIIRPISQLIIKYHHVTVNIENQIALTHVDQVFYNPNEWPVEGTYVFPLPADATVSNFVLWVDGEPVQGKVLDAKEARQTYEEIVRQMRDPALLEYIGRGALQASIFPIPSHGERRIELEYTQALSSDNGLVRYVYPLNTEKFSLEPLESVKVSVHILSDQPIRSVYSPTHPVDVLRDGQYELTASYEDNDVTPDKDFALYFSVGESEAFHLLTYRDPSDPLDQDGFFMLLLAPSPRQRDQTVAKDVLLVLDRSGSMEGEKFQQAQAALRYILQHLNPDDHFYLTSFSTGVETYDTRLHPVNDVEDALHWVDGLNAAGSTDINRALLETVSIADKERPTYLIFLTDGLPTEGVTESQMILQNLDQSAPDNVRLFTFGVGYDVDTFLLDSLSQQHHGLSTYVKPGEALDEILSSFYERISTPVLTNIDINFGEMPVYDIYPSPLPDLFAGSQVIVIGRYRQGGSGDIVLSGEVNGEVQEFNYPAQVFAKDNRSASDVLAQLPRLWATRKIGYLLNEIRLNGPDQETIDQVVHLSIRYGIVTPYTSYLVTEPMPLGAANQEQLSRDTYSKMQFLPTIVSGQAAVEKAIGEGELAQADQAPAYSQDQEKVHTVWTRSFVLSDGIWMDTTYDPDLMQPMKIAFLSPEYFQLAQSRPDVAAALALGDHIIIVIDGQSYEITPDGQSDADLVLPEVVPASTAEVQSSALPTPIPQAALTSVVSLSEATPTTAPGVNTMEDSNPKSFSPFLLLGLLGAGGAGLGLWIVFRSRK